MSEAPTSGRLAHRHAADGYPSCAGLGHPIMLWIVTDAERASPLDFGPYAVLDNRGATMCSHPIWIRQWRALRCARYRRRPPDAHFRAGRRAQRSRSRAG